MSEHVARPPRVRGKDRDLFAGSVLALVGLLATVGGVTAALNGHIHGGRSIGAIEVVYGVALLWSAWQVIRRLTWVSFLIGAPLLLWTDQLDELCYDHAVRGWWPNILAILIVIEWVRRLIWPASLRPQA